MYQKSTTLNFVKASDGTQNRFKLFLGWTRKLQLIWHISSPFGILIEMLTRKSKGQHWRERERTNPELFSLALEQAWATHPEIVDVYRESPPQITCRFGKRKTSLTLQQVDVQAENLYGRGYCTLLALALHDRTGYPLTLLTTTLTEEQWRGHALVRTDDDLYLDIWGVSTMEQTINRYGFWGVKPIEVSREEFCSTVASGEHQSNPMTFVGRLEQLVTEDFAEHLLTLL